VDGDDKQTARRSTLGTRCGRRYAPRRGRFAYLPEPCGRVTVGVCQNRLLRAAAGPAAMTMPPDAASIHRHGGDVRRLGEVAHRFIGCTGQSFITGIVKAVVIGIGRPGGCRDDACGEHKLTHCGVNRRPGLPRITVNAKAIDYPALELCGQAFDSDVDGLANLRAGVGGVGKLVSARDHSLMSP